MRDQKYFTLETIAAFHPTKPSYAVLGKPIAHSLSPIFQKAAFEKLSIDSEYIRMEVSEEELEEAVGLLVKKGFLGWNCTSPLKKRMMELCNQLDHSAIALGSVNTVKRRENVLLGFNTDGLGWVKDVKKNFFIDFQKLSITILGTGGAGKAIAIQSAREGVQKLILVNRTYGNALNLANLLESQYKTKVQVLALTEANVKKAIEQSELFVQALPFQHFNSLGFHWENILRAGILLYDLLYFPNPTPLESIAKKLGCKALNGLGMLIEQGALSFSIWTGLPAPIEIMKKSVASSEA
ncbi:shikimate dehydrogenase [Methylacidiphilum sp. Yel]|jgi:shikimate dehydrogenase|uniref:shikimate dehydrogenase n=1 Tax=Methylacidiphilum sp. Yel TaxID=1847730 RepID=UPI00106B37F8|nr:shikimate dehydrogenase [Methylacidiphilum sp. Yel]TFE66104.1 shikimate dehydrogenase [Methylacidiphilum sp. Yel]